MIVFKQMDEGLNVCLVIKNSGHTWMEVTHNFVNFLQACGYIVDGIDIGEHLVQQYGFQRKEEPESTQEISLPTKKGRRRAKKK